jgi:hypothetical protein
MPGSSASSSSTTPRPVLPEPVIPTITVCGQVDESSSTGSSVDCATRCRSSAEVEVAGGNVDHRRLRGPEAMAAGGTDMPAS